MTERTRKTFSPAFKAKMSLEAIHGVKTANEIAQDYGVHPVQVGQWQQAITSQAGTLFETKRGRKKAENIPDADRLYSEIGRLKVELDWLKKVRVETLSALRDGIDAAGGAETAGLSVRRQGALASVTRSRVSVRSPGAVRDERDLQLLRLIDAEYTRRPCYGSRRMVVSLRALGFAVNRKRVQRLMRALGLAGMMQRQHTSTPHPEHSVYPHLLRGVAITRPNQVRSTDITYVRLAHGFA